MSREKTSATASESGRKTMNAAYAVDRKCVETPTPRSRVQQVGRVVAEEHRAVEVGQLAVDEIRPQQRHDRLQVPVGHVAEVEAQQRGADGHRARRRPALAPDLPHRLARRPARPRAAPRADRDVEPDEQQHADADEHQVQRGDVVGVAQRHVGRVGRDEPDDEREGGHDRAGQDAAPARRRGRARGRGDRLVAASGLATGLEQRPRCHGQLRPSPAAAAGWFAGRAR